MRARKQRAEIIRLLHLILEALLTDDPDVQRRIKEDLYG